MPAPRDWLDAQYSPSRRAGGLEPWLQAYAAGSATARSDAARDGRLHADLAYTAEAGQVLDLYLPAVPRRGSRQAPVVLFLHGGFWQALSRAESSFAAGALAANGAALAVPEYTLAPEASLDQIVDEARTAVVWLHRVAAAYDLDARRLVVAGHSAGAQLAAMLVATDWQEYGLPAGALAGAVLVSGVYDLEPVRRSYVNDAVGMDAAEAARNSPVLLEPVTRCPVVVVWGELESSEFVRQSRELCDAWSAAGVTLTRWQEPGRHHFDLLLDLARPQSRLFAECLRLLA